MRSLKKKTALGLNTLVPPFVFAKKCVSLLVTSVGCLTFAVQRDVRAEIEARGAFAFA